MMNNTAYLNDELKLNNSFIEGTYKKALIPCLLSVLSANINVIVDGMLVGQKLGNTALAAINFCLPINLFICVIGSYFSAGCAINASKSIGSGAISKGNDYYKINILLSLISSVLITLLGSVFLDNICGLICSDSAVIPYVKEYSIIIILGCIFRIMIYIPFWYLRLDGKNREIIVMMASLTFINIILDWLFVFVMKSGIQGAAYANVIATAISCLLGFYYLFRKDSGFKFDFDFDLKLIKDRNIYFDGAPASLINLCTTIRIILVNIVLLSIGGAKLVAVFTAVNGIYGIGECLIIGVPQASYAMLGVYYGERDNLSCKYILKCEIVIGAVYAAVFTLLTMLLTPAIRSFYDLRYNMFIPLAFMCLSVFPALVNAAISGYYNISGRNALSAVIIALRLVIMPLVSLYIAQNMRVYMFSFYLVSELLTLLFIYLITGYYHYKDKDLARFMLCSTKYEREGKIISFTVENSKERICESSELLSEFCVHNNLNASDTMKFQLAIEEALVLISQVNEDAASKIDGYDLRAFAYHDVAGLRIRYSGLDFNPFNGNMESEEYLGIKMISDMLETTLYKRTFGVNTLILLLKENKETVELMKGTV